MAALSSSEFPAAFFVTNTPEMHLTTIFYAQIEIMHNHNLLFGMVAFHDNLLAQVAFLSLFADKNSLFG